MVEREGGGGGGGKLQSGCSTWAGASKTWGARVVWPEPRVARWAREVYYHTVTYCKIRGQGTGRLPVDGSITLSTESDH